MGQALGLRRPQCPPLEAPCQAVADKARGRRRVNSKLTGPPQGSVL